MDELAQTLKITVMAMDDVKDVYRIERLSFPTPWDIASYYAEVENPSSFYLVAHLDEHVVGFGGMWAVEDEAHIVTLAVDPEYRSHGIGRQLMHGLLKEAKRRHIRTVTLEVRVSNAPAKHLYVSFGFEKVACRRNYYPDNNEDAEVMALQLG